MGKSLASAVCDVLYALLDALKGVWFMLRGGHEEDE